MRFKIQTLNNISIKGLERLPRERFEVASEIGNPDAILVRSADMHKLTLPDSLRAVGRAGAGTNNIPVEALSKRGIPVFNAPGANANAVKELVLAGMFLAARNITQAWSFAEGAERSTITRSMSRWRRARRISSGFELPGRTLGVDRSRRHRCRSRELGVGPRNESARLRSADHRAARLAAVVERRAGALAR